jgi:hypothetical protein
MPRGRPELQLRVTRRAQLQQVVVAAIVELQAGDGLRVAAIQTLREPQNRGKRTHRAPRPAGQPREAVVLALRRRLTMIARDERDCFDFVGLEAAQVAVLDQVVRMLVMAPIADVDADVVQDRGVLEPLTLAIGQTVNRAGLVEKGGRQPRDMLRVFWPVVTAFGQLEHAAATDVRVAIGLRDFLSVARDVIEHQPFPQGQIAERDLGRAQPAEDVVEEDGAGHREIGAPRFETGNPQALLEIERDDIPADAADLLDRESPVAQRAGRCAAGGGRDRAEAEDGPRRPDNPLESGSRDLLQVLADFRANVTDQLTLVVRIQRVGLDEALGEPDDAQLEAAAHLEGCPSSPRHLDAAAADVDDHHDVARDAHSIDRRQVDEASFLRP